MIKCTLHEIKLYVMDLFGGNCSSYLKGPSLGVTGVILCKCLKIQANSYSILCTLEAKMCLLYLFEKAIFHEMLFVISVLIHYCTSFFQVFKLILVKCQIQPPQAQCVSGHRSISQVQAHMERGSSMFMFQSSFGAGVSVVLSSLERLFSSIPPTLIVLFFILHSTDLISADGCLGQGLMAGLRESASHGGCILSGGWLSTVEAPGYPGHPPSI